MKLLQAILFSGVFSVNSWKNADTAPTGAGFYRPAGQVTAEQETWKFGDARLRTGITMRYAAQGDARGVPVILLHGITDSWHSWSRVLPAIDRKYRVYALDLRGHGDTDKPPAGYAIKDFAADVVAFMDALKIERAVVVGHSMGSFVALQTALDAPGRVEKLVLVGTATQARNEVVRELHRSFADLKDLLDENFVRDFQIGASSVAVPADFMEAAIRQSMKVPARVWKAALAGILAEDYQPKLGGIKTRTLIVWGAEENIFPRGEQDILKAQIANSTLRIYEGAGHSPHWEFPEKFAADLNEFLDVS